MKECSGRSARKSESAGDIGGYGRVVWKGSRRGGRRWSGLYIRLARGAGRHEMLTQSSGNKSKSQRQQWPTAMTLKSVAMQLIDDL